MSNSAWCDIFSKATALKLQEMCPKKNFKCPKQKTFTSRQFELEGNGIEYKLKKSFKGCEKTRLKFSKPAFIVVAPFGGLALGAKTKNPKTFKLLQKI